MDSINVFILDTLTVSAQIPAESNLNFFSLFKEIFLSIVALSGLIVAIIGLKTWRKQLKGNTEYDLSRRLLRTIYELRESVRIVRNPLITAIEMEESTRKARIIQSIVSADDPKTYHYVYQERWKSISTAISNLNVDLLEAEVLWGGDIRSLANNLLRIIGTLKSGLSLYLEYGFKGIKEEFDNEKVKEIRGLLYDSSMESKDDAFASDISVKIKLIENFLKPFLRL